VSQAKDCVEIGVDCDECGGSGELPAGGCWLCGRTGIVVIAVVAAASLHALAYIGEPAPTEPVVAGAAP
jgi:hypothetical protein